MPMQIVVPRRNYGKMIRTYSVLTFAVVIFAGVYGYFQYTKLSSAQDALNNEQATVTTMTDGVSKMGSDYNDLTAEYYKNIAPVNNSINAAYPSDEDFLNLTKNLDKYFQANNQTTNPIFLSDLKFSKSRIDPALDYAVLPFTMSISTTQDNFDKFLKFIETSGQLGQGTRLMDVRSISINFAAQNNTAFTAATAAPGTSQIPLLNVSISANAYFQKPAKATAVNAG